MYLNINPAHRNFAGREFCGCGCGLGQNSRGTPVSITRAWARRPSPTLILAYLHPLLSSGVHIAGKCAQQRWFPTSVEHRKGMLSLFRHVKVAITILTRWNRLTYTQRREFSLR